MATAGCDEAYIQVSGAGNIAAPTTEFSPEFVGGVDNKKASQYWEAPRVCVV
jgi:hypothetical protein